MKRPSSSIDDETIHSSKFSKNPDSSRKLTFLLNDSVKDIETHSVDSKIKSHQSTPYPKQKIPFKNKIIGNEKNKNEISEKRHPEYLAKITSLNRSFIRWIDVYFNKGYNYDFTPVCNDYIRFINNLKEKYPVETNLIKESSIENSKEELLVKKNQKNLVENICVESTNEDILVEKSKEKNLVQNFEEEFEKNSKKGSCVQNLKEKSPVIKESKNENLIQDQFNLLNSTSSPIRKQNYLSSPYLNTPPPNPGDKNYKSTPYPKYLLKDNKKSETTSVSKNSNIHDLDLNKIPINTFVESQKVSNRFESYSDTQNFFDSKPKTSKEIKFNLFDSDNELSNSIIDESIFSSQDILNNQQPESHKDYVNNDDEYIPPKPEVAKINEDSVYSVKCKLFYKKDSTYVEKGNGTLYIKETNKKSGSYQLLIRGENSLATILLNIRLKLSLPIMVTKNGILLTCIPNPPLETNLKNDNTGTATFYIKVKTNEIRNDLCGKIKKYSN